jgi:hypothetical protein
MSLNPGDVIEVARERLRVEATSPRLKLRSLACPAVVRYPSAGFVEREGEVVERAEPLLVVRERPCERCGGTGVIREAC